MEKIVANPELNIRDCHIQFYICKVYDYLKKKH